MGVSDLNNIKNAHYLPQIPGHEFSGEVYERSFCGHEENQGDRKTKLSFCH